MRGVVGGSEEWAVQCGAGGSVQHGIEGDHFFPMGLTEERQNHAGASSRVSRLQYHYIHYFCVYNLGISRCNLRHLKTKSASGLLITITFTNYLFN